MLQKTLGDNFAQQVAHIMDSVSVSVGDNFVPSVVVIFCDLKDSTFYGSVRFRKGISGAV